MVKMPADPAASRPQRNTLEALACTHVGDFILQYMEDELTALLGWEKSARRAATSL